jgi:rhodanese-related sulfurtransferase/8-oxo-dGTP pyrophosphatase MutT (NUDIX family)
MTDQPEVVTTSSRVVYENPWMRLREDEFTRSDGSRGIYGVVDKPDFAVIVPMDETGFHLVEQWRYPAGGRYWEFPQGTLENEPDVAPEEIARRELAEETGFRAADLRYLGWVHEAYGMSGQRGHAYVATGLTPGEQDLGAEEAGLVCAHVPYAEFPRLVAQGRITDATTLATYALLLMERGGVVMGEVNTIDAVLDAARARIERLSPEQAARTVTDGGVLVDIRPAAQRAAEGEVPGALEIERNNLEWRLDPRSDARLPVARYDLPVVVICSEGYTSSLAAAALRDLGLRHAADVAGGFQAWKAAGLPTTGGGQAGTGDR